MAFPTKSTPVPARETKRRETVWFSLFFAGLFLLTAYLGWLAAAAAGNVLSDVDASRTGFPGLASSVPAFVFAAGIAISAAVVAVGGSLYVFMPADERRAAVLWRVLAYLVFATFAAGALWVLLSAGFGEVAHFVTNWNALGGWGIASNAILLIVKLAVAGGTGLVALIAYHAFAEHYRADFRGEILPRFRELRRSLHLIRRSPLTLAGLILIVAIVAVALLAQFAPGLVVPYPQDAGAVYYTGMDKLPPSWAHPFGTDELGRDYFSRVVLATPLDLYIAVLVVGSALLVGIALGIVAGFFGGWIDEILMRVTDIFLSIPGLILAIAFSAALGGGVVNVMIALIVTWWPGYTRIIRAQTLSIRENLYVEAARAVGAKRSRILMRHLLPNVLAPVLVNSTLDLGSVILVAAALGYLGLGQPPPFPEWGRLVSDGQSYVLTGQWWLATFPGLAILVTSLSFNLVGDGLRDILDPRLRR